MYVFFSLLHSEQPNLYGVLAVLSAVGVIEKKRPCKSVSLVLKVPVLLI